MIRRSMNNENESTTNVNSAAPATTANNENKLPNNNRRRRSPRKGSRSLTLTKLSPRPRYNHSNINKNINGSTSSTIVRDLSSISKGERPRVNCNSISRTDGDSSECVFDSAGTSAFKKSEDRAASTVAVRTIIGSTAVAKTATTPPPSSARSRNIPSATSSTNSETKHTTVATTTTSTTPQLTQHDCVIWEDEETFDLCQLFRSGRKGSSLSLSASATPPLPPPSQNLVKIPMAHNLQGRNDNDDYGSATNVNIDSNTRNINNSNNVSAIDALKTEKLEIELNDIFEIMEQNGNSNSSGGGDVVDHHHHRTQRSDWLGAGRRHRRRRVAAQQQHQQQQNKQDNADTSTNNNRNHLMDTASSLSKILHSKRMNKRINSIDNNSKSIISRNNITTISKKRPRLSIGRLAKDDDHNGNSRSHEQQKHTSSENNTNMNASSNTLNYDSNNDTLNIADIQANGINNSAPDDVNIRDNGQQQNFNNNDKDDGDDDGGDDCKFANLLNDIVTIKQQHQKQQQQQNQQEGHKVQQEEHDQQNHQQQPQEPKSNVLSHHKKAHALFSKSPIEAKPLQQVTSTTNNIAHNNNHFLQHQQYEKKQQSCDNSTTVKMKSMSTKTNSLNFDNVSHVSTSNKHHSQNSIHINSKNDSSDTILQYPLSIDKAAAPSPAPTTNKECTSLPNDNSVSKYAPQRQHHHPATTIKNATMHYSQNDEKLQEKDSNSSNHQPHSITTLNANSNNSAIQGILSAAPTTRLFTPPTPPATTVQDEVTNNTNNKNNNANTKYQNNIDSPINQNVPHANGNSNNHDINDHEINYIGDDEASFAMIDRLIEQKEQKYKHAIATLELTNNDKNSDVTKIHSYNNSSINRKVDTGDAKMNTLVQQRHQPPQHQATITQPNHNYDIKTRHDANSNNEIENENKKGCPALNHITKVNTNTVNTSSSYNENDNRTNDKIYDNYGNDPYGDSAFDDFDDDAFAIMDGLVQQRCSIGADAKASVKDCNQQQQATPQPSLPMQPTSQNSQNSYNAQPPFTQDLTRQTPLTAINDDNLATKVFSQLLTSEITKVNSNKSRDHNNKNSKNSSNNNNNNENDPYSFTNENDDDDDFFSSIDMDALDKIAVERQQQRLSHTLDNNNGRTSNTNVRNNYNVNNNYMGNVTQPPQDQYQLQDHAIKIPLPKEPIHNPRAFVMKTTNSSTTAEVTTLPHPFPLPQYLTHSRYRVIEVKVDPSTQTKVVRVMNYNVHRNLRRTQNKKVPARGMMEKQEQQHCTVVLRGEWYYTPVEAMDIIHIVSVSGRWRTDLSRTNQNQQTAAIVLHTLPPPNSTEDDLMLILHPDLFITPTTISDTVGCSRKAVLRHRMGSTGLSSRAAIVGTMRHSLFEKCLVSNIFIHSPTTVTYAKDIIRQNAETLVGCGISDSDAMGDVLACLPELQRFAADYTNLGNTKNHPDILNHFHTKKPASIGQQQQLYQKQDKRLESVHSGQMDVSLCARGIYATEESVLSPELGLKGFVDATIAASTTLDKSSSCNQHHQQYNHSNHATKVKQYLKMNGLMGVELKTGHKQDPHQAHLAQLSLYTVMLRIRHGSAVVINNNNDNSIHQQHHHIHQQQNHQSSDMIMNDLMEQHVSNGAFNGGVLLYLNDKGYKAFHVSPQLHEIKSLIGQRNAVATEIRRSEQPRGVIVTIPNNCDERNDINVNSGQYTSNTNKHNGAGTTTATDELYAGQQEHHQDADIDISQVPPPTVLPDLLPNAHSCNYCYMNKECMLYTKTSAEAQPVTRIERSHGQLLSHFTSHLTDADLTYFSDWDRMIDLEALESKHSIAKAWVVPSLQREKETGKCVAHLEWISNSASDGSFDDVIRTTAMDTLQQQQPPVEEGFAVLQFKRHAILDSPSPQQLEYYTPLSSLNIETGDHAIISTDDHTAASPISATANNQDKNNSKQKGRFRNQVQVVRGQIQAISETSVFIKASLNDKQQLQRLLTLWTTEKEITTTNHQHQYQQNHEGNTTKKILLFRLDKDEISTGVGTLRQNLVRLFTADISEYSTDAQKKHKQKQQQQHGMQLQQQQHQQVGFFFPPQRMINLRELVVRLSRPPHFDYGMASQQESMFSASTSNVVAASPSRNALPAPLSSLPGCDFMDLFYEYQDCLNIDQKTAVKKVISTQDYALIQGLPGTGKTSTIVFLTRLLAARGKRVLITSYTHAAVDNVLLKLMEVDVGLASSLNGDRNNCTNGNNGRRPSGDLVRIGRPSSCHLGVHGILVPTLSVASMSKQSNQQQQKPSAQALHQTISNARIVGISALTIPRSPLMRNQQFDVVIVDEAGQISQPAILGALMAADSFVLVGDHMQLPPLVSSRAAEKAGYGISMMKRLAEAFPTSVSQLTLQYRMHGDICNLCNEIVYKGALQCANDQIKTEQRCVLPYYPYKVPPPVTMQHNHRILNDEMQPHPNLQRQEGWLQSVLDPQQIVIFVNTDAIVTTQKLFKSVFHHRSSPQTTSKTAAAATATANREFWEMEFSTAMQQHHPISSSLHAPNSLETELGSNKREGSSIVNYVEGILVKTIIHGFVECGLLPDCIGVICPYRSQLRLLNDDTYLSKLTQARGLEISTIDRYQGRDKGVIILSLVRSNNKKKVGRLLNDVRRLNVAISRAKYKLVLVGSFQTLLDGSPAFRPVLNSIKKLGRVKTLPVDAHLMYEPP